MVYGILWKMVFFKNISSKKQKKLAATKYLLHLCAIFSVTIIGSAHEIASNARVTSRRRMKVFTLDFACFPMIFFSIDAFGINIDGCLEHLL
jgi:hypothetical protein